MSGEPLFEGQIFEGQMTDASRTSLETKLLGNMSHLLSNVGSYGLCKFCGQRIVWIKHNNGVSAPYDAPLGTNHMATCAKPEGRKL